ncbi:MULTISPECIES: M24 family metallopeptidase [Paraburkholderia]|jgi:Xaa-Pro aminopeptidase|uniref:Metallopeptidase family M24 n=1 Tax=Paraburkholderia phenazinium TaxID=60549 RepID=A0A1N6KC92_9BURK|nr:M24 family metallopeptidase [Paraburkholderia phenazinium]SIO54209.1 Metallopeptidase family M24 [Paraburkholderia phenazinium]
MSTLALTDLERVGTAFAADTMLSVRDKTRAAIHAIAAQCRPGMVEEDAVEMAKDVLKAAGMRRGWHDVYVRFGSNTTKTFGAPSDPGIVLGEEDIFLIDIGPVWEKWEGDGGDTFITGADAEMTRCARDAKALFHEVRAKWRDDKFTGQTLYEFAERRATELGWKLNLDLSGHRISDFPHAVVYEGPLAEVPFHPAPLLWVLEIHIRHPEKAYGAFFEDMLLGDEFFESES